MIITSETYYNIWTAYVQTSLVAQTVKRLSTMWETWVQSLGWEDPLEKEMAIHSSTIAWKIPWTEEPDRLQSMGSQRVRHNWATSLSLSLSIIFITINNTLILLITLNIIIPYGWGNFSKQKICLSSGATFYLDLLIFMSWWFLQLSLFSYFLLEILHFFLLHKYKRSLGLWPQPLLFNFNIFFPKSYCPL